MRMSSITAAVIAMALSTSAHAVEYLTEVTSDVHEAPGMSPAQIVDRALQCLRATSGNNADNVLPAIDGDTAYAVVITGYRLAFMVPDHVTSRITVVAKKGRFKVMHTNIEHDNINPFTGKRLGVHTQPGGGAKAIETALAERSEAVAACIIKPSEVAAGDW